MRSSTRRALSVVKRLPRIPASLRFRFTLVLCEVAVLSTLLATIFLDRSLSSDLHMAGLARLERSASAADVLVDQHLQAMTRRYKGVIQAPQFVANLETGHKKTLEHYAARLSSIHGAALTLFLDTESRPVASAGQADLLDLAVNRSGELTADRPARLIASRRKVYAALALDLQIGGKAVGRLMVLEMLTSETRSVWSRLCGARVSIMTAGDEPDVEDVVLPVRAIDDLELNVAMSLDAEKVAIANSRWSLAEACLLAILLAFGVSLLLAGTVLRPVREIQRGAERIAAGDLFFRLDDKQPNEVGDVARALNLMLGGLEESQGRLASAQRLARIGNWGIEAETGNVSGSAEFRRIYGFPSAPAGIGFEELLLRIHPDDREVFKNAVEECRQNGRILRLDHRSITVDGEERILHTDAVQTDGSMVLEGMVQDITDRKRVEDQISYLAYHDSLTGLGNRRLLRERLSMALEQIRRSHKLIAVLYLDVDGFKYVNDTLGHQAGDELLREVANRLVECAHAVSEAEATIDTLVTRLGGDEFTVMLSGCKTVQEVEEVARRILGALDHPYRLDGQDVAVTASIGIALAPRDASDVEALLCHSDIAMYHAKRHGASCYEMYDESMQEEAFRRVVLDHKLRAAIENQELELFYQPKIKLPERHVAGMEALIRWHQPELGLVNPSEFIPLAEETGIVTMIGDWVLKEAMYQARVWRQEGLPEVPISVNLSVRQMAEHVELVEHVGQLLQETGLRPELLDLEITESMMLQDEEAAIELLQRLRDMGVSLSLDDFGTGYSSLSYLRRLPIQTLKIDQAFVRQINSDAQDAALAGSIVAMAKMLGLRVVVEGVETEEQCELLQNLGCDEAQGFLFSKPITAREMTELLRLEKKRREDLAGRGGVQVAVGAAVPVFGPPVALAGAGDARTPTPASSRRFRARSGTNRSAVRRAQDKRDD